MSQFSQDNFKLDESSKALLKEIGEDPAQKMSQIEVLRSWIVSHNYLECRTDDRFLLRFLRVSKFSCEGAKERITKWCVARSSKLDGLPEWFENHSINDPKLREILETGFMYLMPKTDKLGRMVMAIEFSRIKHMKLAPVDFCRAMYLFCTWLIFNYDRAQVHGVVMIEAADMIDMDLLTYWNPERMKKSISFLQGAFPMRLKRIEYYNMPAILKTFIDLAMGFMKPKLQKRIKFHSDNKLAENIPAECMPRSLGGDGPEFSEIKDEFFRSLEDFQSEFDSFNICKVDDAKMPKHYEEGDSWGITGSYRPIANDN